LPASALLGSLERAEYPRSELNQSLWRVAVGTIAIGSTAVPCAKVHAYIAARYSLRRTVGSSVNKTPILHFRTQQIPILTAIAQTYVLEAYQKWAAQRFTDEGLGVRVRHGIATCFKAIAVSQTLSMSLTVSERCGAQGLQSFNMMSRMNVSLRLKDQKSCCSTVCPGRAARGFHSRRRRVGSLNS
jgi:hypothetical protein